jgi:NADPH:quinone reductase-like Zn-dependent oxidoreductase
MKAIFFEQHGEIDVLRYAELDDPKPKAGEVLIKVKAVALNHLDIWVRRGWKGLKLGMPHITGCDIAGEIVSAQVDSTWTPGTKVIINPGVNLGEDEWTRRGEDSVSPGYKIIGENLKGGLAEYVCVPAQNVFKMPEEVSFEDAAAPLLTGLTCWRMLFKRTELKPGESVLLVGSGGGVNSLAISFCKAAGATVYALAGGKEKTKHALDIGADFAIDYTKHEQWPLEVLKLTRSRGVDVVVDNVGKATFQKSLHAVARGGRIVTAGNTSGYDVSFDNRFLFSKQVSLIGSTMGSKQDFIDCQQFMRQNNIKAVIDKVEKLKDGIKMIKRLEDGKQFGKIVLKP